MAETVEGSRVERVQLGVRMEKQMVQVLKGLAEFKGHNTRGTSRKDSRAFL